MKIRDICLFVSVSILASVQLAQRDVFAQSRTAPVILNVVDYGAIPNDEIDDTAAIQVALDTNFGKKWDTTLGTWYYPSLEVHFPTGVYLVTGLTVNNAYTTLRGTGMYSSVIKLQNASGPVIHLKGAAYVNIEQLGIDGGGTASYGVFAEDLGYVPERQGDLAPVHVEIKNSQIRQARGSPGIGFANTDRAHTSQVIDTLIWENNIGVKLVRRAQHTLISNSTIRGNYEQQIVLGDGYNYLRDISIRDSNIEGRNEGTAELMRLDGVSPLNMNAIYFESHRSVDATDITTVNLPSNINLNGLYSNGGVPLVPLRSFLFRTKTNLILDNATFVSTKKVYEIGTPEGDPAVAKPAESKVTVRNSIGPGLTSGLMIDQGGQTWNDGVSLKFGAHTWDIVVGKDGRLWFGYNKGSKMTLSPKGEWKATP